MTFITRILSLSVGLLLPTLIEAEESGMKEVQTPTCSLDQKALEERKETILRHVKEKMTHVERMSEGYRFRLPRNEESLQLATSVILLESQCCPFLDFHIAALAGSDDIQFTITAPSDAQDLIDDLFGGEE